MTTLALHLRTVLLSASEGGLLHKLRRDSVLFPQQQEATGVFFVASGLVKLTRTSYDGCKLILSVVGPHQLIGEECLTQVSTTFLATSACLTEVTGYHIPLANLKRLLSIQEFAHALLSYISECNIELAHKLELLALRDVEYRVLHGLAALALRVKPTPDGNAYPIPMTQAEIASFVGATRETTSTTLSALKRRQLLTLSRGWVTTVHPDRLINAANDGLSKAKGAG
jgi:CRP-like cAMP-binding protein